MIVAQIMAGAPAGGAELFFERLCIALSRAGETVVPIIRNDPARAARLRAQHLAPHQLGFGGPLDLLTRPRLAALLRRTRPSVAIGWMSRAAAALPRGPWITVGRLGGYYDLKRFGHCQHLVANTEHIARWIISQGRPAAQVTYLPNFVPDLLGATPLTPAALGVPHGAPLLLALGRLHPAKGLDILIRALTHLPDAHAVIAGEGAQRPALRHLAAELGVSARLHLPGWRTDIGPLLAAATLFVSSARHEPLGNAVLEAWSAARPVIAAAAHGPAALITPGIDGLITPIDDPAALATAIASLLADPARATSLAQAGRAHYLARFAERPVVAQWRAFLAALVQPPPHLPAAS